MTVPHASCNAGIYTFYWDDEKIGMRIDRLSEDSKGVLSGEIIIKSGLPGADKHIHMARINLTSGETRNRLSKVLTERLNHVDWYSLLEQACVMTLTKYREGEPVLDIGDVPDYEAVRYRLNPLLFEGEPTLVYGPGGTGKSYLGLYIANLVQYNIAGAIGWIPESGNVLILDWETSYAIYRRRCWAIKQGLGIQDMKDRIKYRYCTQPLAADVAEIQKIVLENKINLAIVDSCGYAAGGDPNQAEIAIRYFGALRSLRISTLTLDHVSKGLDGGKSPFGSVYKTNASRSVFQLKKVQDAGANEYELGLYHEKVNEGRPLKPIGYKSVFTNNENGIATKVEFQPIDILDNPALAASASLPDRIDNYLKQVTTSSMEEISEFLDVDEAKVRTELYRNKKRFVNINKGKSWGRVVLSEENQ